VESVAQPPPGVTGKPESQRESGPPAARGTALFEGFGLGLRRYRTLTFSGAVGGKTPTGVAWARAGEEAFPDASTAKTL
jgi:hypothetical protein